jgi:hypothetical protein
MEAVHAQRCDGQWLCQARFCGARFWPTELVRSSADPDDISAQIDLIGVPWLMIGEEPSAAPNGGSRAGCSTRSTQIE